MQSQIKIYLPACIAILVVGAAFSKFTVADNISLSALEQECIDTNWPTLYDNPLERVAISVLGDTAVTEKKGESVYTTSYTLFRVPVGKAVFQCTDGSSFKIPKTEEGIQQAILEAQYCEVKSDCVPVDAKCPFGCYVFVNHNEASRIQTFIDSYDSRCAYSCVALHGYDCVSNRCEVLFEN